MRYLLKPLSAAERDERASQPSIGPGDVPPCWGSPPRATLARRSCGRSITLKDGLPLLEERVDPFLIITAVVHFAAQGLDSLVRFRV